MESVWIARDDSGTLWLFYEKPRKINDALGTWWGNKNKDIGDGYEQLDSDAFPSVTVKNSPKELVLKGRSKWE